MRPGEALREGAGALLHNPIAGCRARICVIPRRSPVGNAAQTRFYWSAEWNFRGAVSGFAGGVPVVAGDRSVLLSWCDVGRIG